jgi:hypothetical protein
MTKVTAQFKSSLRRWFIRHPEQNRDRRHWYEVENCGVH